MESKKNSRRHHRLPADSDLFSDTGKSEKEKTANKWCDDTEKISFKIGRTTSKCRSSNNHRNTNSKVDQNSKSISDDVDEQSLELSGSSNSGGISSATTIPVGSIRSSQEDMFASQAESSSSNSVNMPNDSACTVDYEDFMKSSGETKNHLNSPSSESTVNHKTSKTSTPRKRKPERSLSDSNSKKLPRINEEVPSTGGNSRQELNASQGSANKGTTTCSNLSNISRFQRLLSGSKTNGEGTVVDNELPDTQIIEENPAVEVLHAKARKSLEVVYVGLRSSRSDKSSPLKSVSKEVFDVEDNEDGHDSYELCLSQTQTQMEETQVDVVKDTNSKERYIVDIVDDDPEIIETIKPKRVNGSSSLKGDIIEIVPLNDTCTKLPVVLIKDNKLVSNDNSPDNPPSSYLTFQKVKAISNQQQLNLSKIDSDMESPNFTFMNSKAQNQSQVEEVINLDSDHQNTPESNGNGAVDTFQATASCTITWKYSINTLTKEVVSREVLKCDVEEVAPEVLSQSNISPGALADVSGHSKNNSPSSVTSSGPFTLAPTRQSMISIVSGSSSSSAGSAASLQANAALKAFGSLQPSRQRPTNLPVRYNGRNPLFFTNMSVITEKLVQIECNSSLIVKDNHFASPSLKLKRGKKVNAIKVLPPTPLENAHKVVVNQMSEPYTTTEAISPALVKKNTKKGGKKAPTRSEKKETVVSKSTIETPKSNTKKERRGRKKVSNTDENNLNSLETIAEIKSIAGAEDKKSTSRKLSLPRNVPSPQVRTTDEVASCSIPAFARWKDKKYYAAVIQGKKNGRFNVRFDDGNCKVLVEDHVIEVNQLMKGLSVYAEVHENEFEPGLIFDFKVDDGVVLYIVQLDSGINVTVSRSAISMSDDQAGILKKEVCVVPSMGTPKRLADVSMDNICEGKRVRGLKTVDVQVPGVSGIGEPRLTPKSDVSDAPNSNSEEIGGVELENYSLTYPSLCSDGLSKASKSKVKGICTSSTEKSNDKNIINLLGPIPTDGKMFAGMRFLLTCSDTWDYHLDTKDDYNDNSTYSTSSENEFKSYTTAPFVRQRLTKQLVAGGGVVYHKFEELEKQKFDTCFLIANGPCHTENYILCLANKITIINHEWVIFCSKESKKLPIMSFVLPAGFSTEKKKFVEFKDRQAKRLPLKNMDIMLASEMDSYVAFWSKVLETAGARVSCLSFESQEKPSAEGIDLVVADHTLTPKMKTWALNFDLTIVTSEWIKQCIINCEKSNIHFQGYQYVCFS